jgi:hypothetical protein
MNLLRRVRFTVFLCFCATGASAASLSEQEERATMSREVIAAFYRGNVEALEAMSQAYRSEKSRTSSGLWRLTVFYASIGRAIRDKAKEGEHGFKFLESRIDAWAVRYPTSPVPSMALSSVHLERAWSIRGTGYASTVKPEAWKPFAESVERARTVLEQSKSIASIDPHWYGVMLEVAALQGWERDRFDKLLNEALEREPVFYQTYFTALEYLLPKWHGNLGQIEMFAREAVKRTSKSEGQGMYARIYWYASESQFGSELFQSSAAQWPKMKSGFDDVIARYPDSWNLNNYAKFSCLARDKAKTTALLKRVGASIEPMAWPPGLLKTCVDWTAASPASAARAK